MKKFKQKMMDSMGRDRDRDLDSDNEDSAAAQSPDPGTDHKKSSVSDKVSSFLKDGYQSSLQMGKSEYSDALKSLQKSAGLGHKPDVVPQGPASIKGDQRIVEIGWHPVAGSAGKWFAESIIGAKIQERTKNYPDPSQHWAILVGEYVHELWMDGNLDIIYINEKLNRDEWHTFHVGKTRFNDQALRKAARMTIHNMREKKKAYNLISNNCQNFAVNMLSNIQVGAHRDFATSFVVYQHVTGDEGIGDLWGNKPAEEQADDLKEDEGHETQEKRQDNVNLAQQVMEEHTTKMDEDHD